MQDEATPNLTADCSEAAQPRPWAKRLTISSSAFKLMALALSSGFGLFALIQLHQMYLGEQFAFHDLGLLDDILASLGHFGKVFYISDSGVNHLGVHFTPTLFLVTPLFSMFDSQFLLISLNVFCMVGAVFVAMLLLRQMLREQLTSVELVAATLLFFALVWRNVFFWNALTAAHFEEFYTFLAMILLYFVIQERPLLAIAALFILTLGCRQDAGFFLFFQLGSLAFLPKKLFKDRKMLLRRIFWLALISFAYTVFVTKVVFPLLGTDASQHAKRFWSHFGMSFEEILSNMIAHPNMVVDEIRHSAFFDFNKSFLLIQWLNPLVAALNNLPGTLFYITNDHAKKMLHYYNSCFLMPGLFLSYAAGLFSLKRLVNLAPTGIRTRLSLAPLLLLMAGYTLWDLESPGQYSSVPSIDARQVEDGQERLHFIDQALKRCIGIETVATDFNSVVFLPNTVGKYLPAHYGKADAVFVFARGNHMLSGFSSQAEFLTNVQQNPAFKLMAEQPDASFFVQHSLTCK